LWTIQGNGERPGVVQKAHLLDRAR
jgi:hypothetical protein